MSLSPIKRRLFIGGGVLACGLLVTALLARLAFTGFAIGFLLKEAGATETTFNVTRASPWHLVVENVAFVLKAQDFAAKRVSFTRAHWWSSSLGKVKVEEARMPLSLDRLVAAARAETKPSQPSAPSGPLKLPLEEFSVDGQVVVQLAGVPDQTLTVKIAAKANAENKWGAQVQVNAPGLGLTADGTYDLAAQQVEFSVQSLTLDVKPWQAFVGQLIPLPDMDGWEVSGRFSGNAAGTYAAGKLAATGNVQLREGRVANAAKAITADGVELDLEFRDLVTLQTKPSHLRVREVNTGKLVLRDITAEFALQGLDRIDVSSMQLTALGGTVSTEPYTFVPDSGELKAVLLVDGMSVEEIMALTKDLPAKAKGRVNGRFPLGFDSDGWHLGTGWLELKPGVNAEVAFNAAGLLTAGTSPKSPSYGVLQRIESGLLNLGISELRLDIRPPNAPPGRSATLHISGAPLDPTVKAPVTLDLNVNGPLEKLLNLGMNPRLNAGSKP